MDAAVNALVRPCARISDAGSCRGTRGLLTEATPCQHVAAERSRPTKTGAFRCLPVTPPLRLPPTGGQARTAGRSQRERLRLLPAGLRGERALARLQVSVVSLAVERSA